MFQVKSPQQRKFWLVVSIALAAITLFGAVYWAPAHNSSSLLFWAIFALMAYQSYSLHREGQSSTGTVQ